MALDNELLDEENFAEMFAESENRQKNTRIIEGEIVEIQMEDNRVLVSISDKLEGILNLDEIRDENGNLKFTIGDKIKVMQMGYFNERPKISYKKALEHEKSIAFIDAHKEDFENIIVEGVITKKNRGGYEVDSDGVSFFMPRSLSAFKEGDNVVGRKIKALIIKINEAENSIVISRRKLFNEERKKKREIIDQLMAEDVVVTGIVSKITTYGVFVDVGGVNGLVHYNEISHKGPVNPLKYYNLGDEVNVKAVSYDKDKHHLALSIKAVLPNPWAEVESDLDEGDTITVTVSRIENYGVFVDLGNGIEGFLHVSEISWDRNVKKAEHYLTVGEEIDVEVIEINSSTHKLRVSLKRLLPKPFEAFLDNYYEGDIVTGVITSLTDFGAFVRVAGVEGLLHNQDVSWEKNTKAKELFKSGEEVEVKIARIHALDQKISFNRKTLLESPIDKFATNHKVNSVVTATVRDIKEFGVFVSLENGIDALIREEDLTPLVKDELEIGQIVEAAIANIDTNRDRVRLSVKKLEYVKNQAILEEINDNESHSLGDLIKDKFK